MGCAKLQQYKIVATTEWLIPEVRQQFGMSVSLTFKTAKLFSDSLLTKEMDSFSIIAGEIQGAHLGNPNGIFIEE